MTTDQAVETLSDHDVPVAPVVALEDLHEHPQMIANGTVGTVGHPVLGSVRQANPMIRFDDNTVADLPTASHIGANGR